MDRSSPRWRSGNRITLLRDGADYFPALLAALAGARDEVFLESYLFEPDAVGRQVAAALIWAARRGVRVQLLLDGFGARDLPARLRQQLDRAGVRLLFFRPDHRLFAVNHQRLYRLHRKLAVVDGRVGFVGGINIIDDRSNPGMDPRRDYAVRVEGPLVHDLRRQAAGLWRSTCRGQLKRAWLRIPGEVEVPPRSGGQSAALVIRDTFRHRRSIEAAYLRAIDEARKEVLIANAYFLPGRRFRHRLLDAARRGVRVVLLLQGQIENPLQHHAVHALYRPLLQAGVAIYEYQPGFMHAKVAVVDQRWLTVGSSNIDPLSLLTAREANVLVRDEGLAAELRADLLRLAARHSVAVRLEDIDGQSIWRRGLAWLAYQLVRGLLGLTGYGGKAYLE